MERAVYVPDLDRLPAPDQSYDRLYLGSEFCVWRLPGERELHEALTAATNRGLGFSLVTPFLDEPGLTRTLALVRTLPENPAIEIVANDVGLIESLRESGWRGMVVAGRLLTRQRRGPGFQSFGEIPAAATAAMRGSALDSPAFVALLGSQYGVRRFELDDLVQGIAVPDLPADVSLSLYRPYLLVTATRNCPWVFDGHTWDRSRGCTRPCRSRALRLVSGVEKAPSAAAYSSDASKSARRKTGFPGLEGRGLGADGKATTPTPSQSSPLDREENRSSRRGPTPDDGLGPLLLGGCAQFFEHRSAAPPPAGVDRIVWQPEIPV